LYKNNIEYSQFVARFIERNRVRSVVDLGCGDWQFSRYINWDGTSYLGVDVVPFIVKRNAEKFGSETVRFQAFSGLPDLPPADLLLCKDVMQHWPNDMVALALDSIRGKYRYVLLTNDEEPLDLQNRDIPLADWRPLDVRRPPFNQRAATVFSWYVHDKSLVRKATMLLLNA
jgi:SAM-dependent methyltransferase